jgi:hypothetical protein
MKIELDGYGFMFDSEWCYISLSWQVLALVFTSIIAYKSYKAYKMSKWYTPVTDSVYTEYLYDKLDSYINYSEYLSSNTYVDTANTIFVDSDYSTY